MRHLKLVLFVPVLCCLLTCAGDETPAARDAAAESSAEDEEGAVFKDDFEGGDASEWEEGEEEGDPEEDGGDG